MLLSVNVSKLIVHLCDRETALFMLHLRRRPALVALADKGAIQLLSDATLAEFPIEILLWEIPLNSHFADAAQAERCRRGLRAPRRSYSRTDQAESLIRH
jgi:hypothetical protein